MLTHGGEPHRGERPDLLVVFLYFDRFEVLGFKNLAAIETLYVIHAVPAGDDLGTIVIAGELHNDALLRIILTGPKPLSSPLFQLASYQGLQSCTLELRLWFQRPESPPRPD